MLTCLSTIFGRTLPSLLLLGRTRFMERRWGWGTVKYPSWTRGPHKIYEEWCSKPGWCIRLNGWVEVATSGNPDPKFVQTRFTRRYGDELFSSTFRGPRDTYSIPSKTLQTGKAKVRIPTYLNTCSSFKSCRFQLILKTSSSSRYTGSMGVIRKIFLNNVLPNPHLSQWHQLHRLVW